MILRNNKPAVHSLNLPIDKTKNLSRMIVILPKDNEISEKDWEILSKHPKVRERLNCGAYSIVDHKDSSGELNKLNKVVTGSVNPQESKEDEEPDSDEPETSDSDENEESEDSEENLDDIPDLSKMNVAQSKEAIDEIYSVEILETLKKSEERKSVLEAIDKHIEILKDN